MSYIAERRGEEKERRRAEILDAAEALYAKTGWDALTVDQVARSARLSRALVYVYFRDKEELLFAIGERAMALLRERFTEAAAGHALGLDKVEAIGRAYMGYAYEFPHYFDFCTRFQAHSVAIDPGSHEDACRIAGDDVKGVVVRAIEAGIADGSIRPDIGEPVMFAMTPAGDGQGQRPGPDGHRRPRYEQLRIRTDTHGGAKRASPEGLSPFF
jgi:TetR/AcrR family transcriptional regulator